MARKGRRGIQAQFQLNPFALATSIAGGIGGAQQEGLSGFLQGFSNPTGYFLKQRTNQALGTPEGKQAIDSFMRALGTGDQNAVSTTAQNLTEVVRANGGSPEVALGYIQSIAKTGAAITNANANKAKAMALQQNQQLAQQFLGGQGGGAGGQVRQVPIEGSPQGFQAFLAPSVNLGASGTSVRLAPQIFQTPDAAIQRQQTAQYLGVDPSAVSAANQLGGAGAQFLAGQQGGGAGGVGAALQAQQSQAINQAAAISGNNAAIDIQKAATLNQLGIPGAEALQTSRAREAAAYEGKERALAPGEAQPSQVQREVEAREAGQTLEAETQKQVQGFAEIDNLVQDVISNYDKGQHLGYFGENKTVQGMKRSIPGAMSGRETVFKQSLNELRSARLYQRSGAQINNEEMERLLASLPLASDTPEVFEAGINRFIKSLEALKATRQKLSTTPRSGYTAPNTFFPGQKPAAPRTAEEYLKKFQQ